MHCGWGSIWSVVPVAAATAPALELQGMRVGASALSHCVDPAREQRMVDERFDVTLAREYDDDQIGELDDLYGEEIMAGALGEESDLMMQALSWQVLDLYICHVFADSRDTRS